MKIINKKKKMNRQKRFIRSMDDVITNVKKQCPKLDTDCIYFYCKGSCKLITHNENPYDCSSKCRSELFKIR